DIKKNESFNPAPPLTNNFSLERKQLEKDLIIKALKESNYNKTKAAVLLSMNRTTLWKKLKEHNIDINSVFSS
ncbi:MAG: sigma54 specific transcriptional regulator, Fis family, partial [Clostridiales bacterium]|nr:sigma54 specific transcriptional regulator, Fis family [Clostridiales bacterium]